MTTNKRQKRLAAAVTTMLLMLMIQPLSAQKLELRTDVVKGETHIAKDDFPKGNAINKVDGWGGMSVAINEFKGGTDFTPLLAGLKDDLCQVPHWGYLEKGKIRVINAENKTEVISEGEVFYMPPGHTMIVDEDARIIDFSPEKEMNELNAFVLKKLASMQSKK